MHTRHLVILVKSESRSGDDLCACISYDSGLVQIWKPIPLHLELKGNRSVSPSTLTSLKGYRGGSLAEDVTRTDLRDPVLLRTDIRAVSHCRVLLDLIPAYGVASGDS